MPFVRAKTTFLMPGRRRVTAGTILRDDDPIVVKRRSMFEPLPVDEDRLAAEIDADPVVEEATARPGERRSTGRRKAPKDD